MRHLSRLGGRISIPIATDEAGLIGRECPNAGCHGYFKIKPGTGLTGENLPCHCPYCGHTAGPDHFWTRDQLEFAQSAAIRRIQDALRKDIREVDRRLRSSRQRSFIKLRMDYKATPHPIHHYREKELETQVTCGICSLDYAVYGVFAFCPDCRTHNSPQILNKNLDLALKELELADKETDDEFARYLVEDALENAVSAFDGFGRAICGAHAALATDPDRARNISFQNLRGADQRVRELFGFCLEDGLDALQWHLVDRCFQKRHLLAHRMGVVDQEYLRRTQDPQAIVGRKVPIDRNEVSAFADHLRCLGSHLGAEMERLP